MSGKQSLKAGATLPSARLQRVGTTKVLLREADGSTVRRTVLPGGLRVITEEMPSTRSASVGIWAGVGSRDETPEMAGSAHFLEHLLFKGTKTRDAMEISAPIEAVGGEFNAYTTKEYTTYYARLLGDDLPVALELLSDMLTNSVIHPRDFAKERQVILEEIAMREDDFADSAHEAFIGAMYGEADLGRPILGTTKTIQAAERDAVWQFYRKHYRPHRLVVAAAGDVDHAEVVALTKKFFGAALRSTTLPAERRRPRGVVDSSARLRVIKRKTEQSHLVWGVPAFARGDDRRFAAGVLNAVLGGGMSSRLFQEVRESRGLAYSVYSFLQTFADTGYLGIYTGSIPAKLPDALQVIEHITADLVRDGVTSDELARGIGQVRGGTVLGMEDCGARMSRIAKAELISGELFSIDELVARIEAVQGEDVNNLASTLLAGKPTIGVVGPYAGQRDFTKQLKRGA